MKSILVAATHRSGSYLACDWLSQLGGLPFPEEYFNFDLLTARQEFRLSGQVPMGQVLETLISNRIEAYGVFTVKAMWPAFESLFAELAIADGKAPEDFQEHAFKWLGKPIVLFIRRRDKVRQAVSFEIAKQTGTWRKEKGGQANSQDLLYSYPRILDCWNQIHDDEASWLKFFKEKQLDYHEIWYEDLVASPNEQIRQALDFIGADVRSNDQIESRFEKLSRGLNRDWAERFQQRKSKVECPSSAQILDPNPTASVRSLEDVVRVPPHSTSIVDFELTNEGQNAWVPEVSASGVSDYTIELRDSSSAEKEVIWRAELEDALLPGESSVLSVSLNVFERLDAFHCDVALFYPGGEHVVRKALSVIVELDEKWQTLRRIFQEIHTSEMYGWIRVEAFGDMWIQEFPFVYLREHGWLHVDTENSSPGVFCALDFELKYFAVHLYKPREFHVFLRNDEPACCLEFLGADQEIRRFRDAKTGELLNYPLSYEAGEGRRDAP